DLTPARSRSSALGVLRHRGTRPCGGDTRGMLRRRVEGAPRCHRRDVGDGDDERDPRRFSERRAADAGHDLEPERVPSETELLIRARLNLAGRPMQMSRTMARAVPQFGRLQDQLMRQAIKPPPSTIPRTRWSGAVSAHRVFDAIKLDLDDLRRIKTTVDG